MSTAAKPRTLPPYGETTEERSSVRRTRRPSRADLGSYAERSARIDLKLHLAKIVLSELPAGAPKGRLLRIAILRRDEVLLDELLDLASKHAAGDSA